MKYYLILPFFLLTLFSFSHLAYGKDPSHEAVRTEASDPFSSHSLDPLSSSHVSDQEHDPLIDHLNEPDNFQAKFMNMIFILALLIGFMVLASWMLKRMMKTRVSQMNSSSSIKVLETRPLSPRSNLYLIEVQGQTLLLAESHTGVTHLASLNAPEEEEQVSSEGRSLHPYFSNPSK